MRLSIICPMDGWPDAEEACPNMPTRYCDWDCRDACHRFPWKPGKGGDGEQ